MVRLVCQVSEEWVVPFQRDQEPKYLAVAAAEVDCSEVEVVLVASLDQAPQEAVVVRLPPRAYQPLPLTIT